MSLPVFWFHTRRAFRALLPRRKPMAFVDVLHAPVESNHPSMLCSCDGGDPVGALADHDPGCAWLAAMCGQCHGTGWCPRCGGDGCEPEVAP